MKSEINTENYQTDELIREAQKGDKKAFRLLVDLHKNYAFAVSFKILLNEEDARDAAQEAFIKLWQNIGSFNFEAKFTTWFYRIIANNCIDRLKSKKRRLSLFHSSAESDFKEPSSENFSDDISNKELAAIIHKLTDKLPHTQKLVFSLRDLSGIPQKEICALLNMNEGAVKTNLFYARKHLRNILMKI